MQFLPECKGCADRRELIAKWAQAWAEWAQNPLSPRPGSPQWLAKHPEFSNGAQASDHK